MSARKLRRRAADIDAFATALVELMPLLEASEVSAGGYQRWRPRRGSELEVAPVVVGSVLTAAGTIVAAYLVYRFGWTI